MATVSPSAFLSGIKNCIYNHLIHITSRKQNKNEGATRAKMFPR